jgi:hypothetical protein
MVYFFVRMVLEYRVWTVCSCRSVVSCVSYHYGNNQGVDGQKSLAQTNWAIGIGCADGHRRHLDVGKIWPLHMPISRRHRLAVSIDLMVVRQFWLEFFLNNLFNLSHGSFLL